jgi:hypothetical protein
MFKNIYSAHTDDKVRGLYLAHVAQSVEHFLGKEEVIGSNPIVGSRVDEVRRIFPKK